MWHLITTISTANTYSISTTLTNITKKSTTHHTRYREPTPRLPVPEQAIAQAPLGSLETVPSFTILEGSGPVHGDEVLVSPVPTWTLAESGPLAPASDQASLDAGTAAAGGGAAPAAAGEGAVAAAIAARAGVGALRIHWRTAGLIALPA